MALPLLWIGAAAAVTYMGVKHSDRIARQRGFVDVLPGESKHNVKPVNGAIVCCEIYNVLDHTGIWVDDSIIELSGKGLIRGITPERFLSERSGDKIFIACDEYHEPLLTGGTDERAISHLYQYREYDLIKNNCHRFVWEAVTGDRTPVSRFADLNQKLSILHDSLISWHELDV